MPLTKHAYICTYIHSVMCFMNLSLCSTCFVPHRNHCRLGGDGLGISSRYRNNPWKEVIFAEWVSGTYVHLKWLDEVIQGLSGIYVRTYITELEKPIMEIAVPDQQ